VKGISRSCPKTGCSKLRRVGEQSESSNVAVLAPEHARSGEIAFSVLSIVMQFAVITAVVTAILWARRDRRAGSEGACSAKA
jgi:UDP-N-acetylmuramyl pentapeptide synthase